MSSGTLAVVTENEWLRAEIEKFRIFLRWTSAADGTVDQDITRCLRDSIPGSTSPVRIIGSIVMVETVPGVNGDRTTDCPDAGYDITLLDAYGLDVAAGYLEDRSTSAAERVVPTQPLSVHGEVTLHIEHAGNAKSGMIILWFE